MVNYWVGIASKDHVMRGVAGGFCQLGHGKPTQLARLRPGDWIIYYSPRDRFEAGTPLQAFTAIGEIQPGDVYQSEMAGGFRPFRRDVRFVDAEDAPIRPLLSDLSFTKESSSWGQAFRRGAFKIGSDDFAIITKAMNADVPALTTRLQPIGIS